MLRAIALFICAFAGSCLAAAPTDSTFRYRINLNGGLIVNRAFSNVTRKAEYIDENTVVQRTPPLTGNRSRTGFSIGADLLFFRGENFKGVVGLAFSRTGAAHHYEYLSVGPTNHPGYSTAQTNTSEEVNEVYNALDVSAGARVHVGGKFFLTSSFVLNSPVTIRREIEGVTRILYTNNSGGSDSTIFAVKESGKYKRTSPNLSLRFNLEYQFDLGKSLARVYLFRNFGLIYKLPWWGLGFSYTIAEGRKEIAAQE